MDKVNCTKASPLTQSQTHPLLGGGGGGGAGRLIERCPGCCSNTDKGDIAKQMITHTPHTRCGWTGLQVEHITANTRIHSKNGTHTHTQCIFPLMAAPCFLSLCHSLVPLLPSTRGMAAPRGSVCIVKKKKMKRKVQGKTNRMNRLGKGWVCLRCLDKIYYKIGKNPKFGQFRINKLGLQLTTVLTVDESVDC